jgi:catechol 2,3-dioxygenase-like lactoylglutathione lyase family enzyme
MNPSRKTKPNVKQAVPFFRVTDIEVSVRYYVDNLGFEMTKQWVPEGKLRWCWLQLPAGISGRSRGFLHAFASPGLTRPRPSTPLPGTVVAAFFLTEVSHAESHESR